METWPTQLPAPSNNFGGSVKSSVARTKMDSGYIRQQLRFTQQVRQMKATWLFDDTQFAIFQAWWKYKIKNGTEWFLMNLPLGSGIRVYTVRFVGDFDHPHKPVLNWNVSATLECLNGSPLTEAELNALLAT